jgi:hypothetical protein
VPAQTPVSSKRSVRVVSMYATRWRDVGKTPSATPLDLDLGVLTSYYDFYKDRLPRLLSRRPLNVADVRFDAPVPDVSLTSAEISLFALPSNQIVSAATLHIETGPLTVEEVKTGIGGVLEHCIHAELMVGGRRLSDYIDTLAIAASAQETPTEVAALLPERHLLVFVPREGDEGAPDKAVIEEIVYRDAPP